MVEVDIEFIEVVSLSSASEIDLVSEESDNKSYVSYQTLSKSYLN